MVHVFLSIITCTKIKIKRIMTEKFNAKKLQLEKDKNVLNFCDLLLTGKHQVNVVSSSLQPFYGGKKHRVTSEIFAPNEKKPIVTIDGEWNGVMYAKYATGVRSFLHTSTC